MKVMMLAAGLGTRLRPVTNTWAKPAVPFLNVPLLFWSLEFVRELRIDRIVANLHHLPETIQRLGPQIKTTGTELVFSLETEAPLGSGGGLWHARNEFIGEENFLIANADEVILPLQKDTLKRLQQKHDETDAIATLLTMRRPGIGTKFGGVWVDHSGKVLGFGFDKDQTRFPQAVDGLHYVGVMLLNRRIFKYLPEGESNILYEAVTKAIAAGETVSLQTEDLVWVETGSAADFLSATDEILTLISPQAPDTSHKANAARSARSVLQKYLESGTYLWESHNGARLFSSEFATGSVARTDVCRALEDRQSQMSEKEKAFAVIGLNAFIESPLIFNSVILPGAHVSKNARLQNSISP